MFNRGVEKRDIFMDDNDRSRFLAALVVFNDKEPDFAAYRLLDIGYPTPPKKIENPLVEIMAFCLMPNHFHMMLRAVAEDGITTFMRKLGVGYTNYFNLKYTRVGSLFQGKYKAVPIVHYAHLLYLPHYIHSNPLDIGRVVGGPTSNSGEGGGGEEEMLKEYPWSSLGDYFGRETFDRILQKQFIGEIFTDYQKDFSEWLPSRPEKLDELREQKIIFD